MAPQSNPDLYDPKVLEYSQDFDAYSLLEFVGIILSKDLGVELSDDDKESLLSIRNRVSDNISEDSNITAYQQDFETVQSIYGRISSGIHDWADDQLTTLL